MFTLQRKTLTGAGAFVAGFIAIVLLGKGVNGYLVDGLHQYVPNGIFLQGIVLGVLNGMLAVGLVLIYRTNRIINFAQGELGAFAATLAAELVQRFHVPFYVAVFIGLLAAVLSSAFIEFVIIRRFSKAPRLILTVATIAVAQILGAVEVLIPYLFNKHAQLETGFHTPLTKHFEYGKVIFAGDHIVALIVTPIVVAGLIWFLRGTGYGLAARASAENSDRARLLGVRVKRVSLLVWVIAGFLSALTAILQAPITGFQLGAITGFGLLMPALAAAVIGRMESLPVTFGAAILISTAQQTIYFGTGKAGPDTGVIFFALLVALLVQRRRLGRTDVTESSWQAVQEVRPVPRELVSLPEVRLLRWGGTALGLVLLLVIPLALEPDRISLASVIMLYAMVGISLVLLTGWSGNVSLGHWAIVGVGALLGGRLASVANPPDFFLVLLICGLAGAFVAVMIGLPALRIRGLFLGVTTLGFALAAGSWFFQSFDIFKPRGAILRPVIFGVFDVTSERNFYYVCLIALVLTMLGARNLRNSRIGRVLIGMRDNEKAAQAFGVPLVRTKLTAFAASGFIAAVAGALYAYHQQQLRPDRFPSELSLFIFSMVVIGGMGSMSGAILGAIYVRGTQYFLPVQFQLLVTGLGVLLLLLFFPGGLGQILYQLRDAYLRRVANRRGLLVPSLVADKRVTEDVALPVPEPVVA
ncbi:MAG: branched-chain amino acid transport system permease protein livM [Actinomycetota bacterium]